MKVMNLFFELKINDKNSLMFFIPSDVEDKLNYLFYAKSTEIKFFFGKLINQFKEI